MKVVQINSECGRGSTGKIAVSISKILTQQGIENYIFYSGNHKSDYQYGIQINSKFDLRCHQVLSRIFGDQGWHSYAATRKLVRRLGEIKPDVVHLHNLHGYYLHLPTLFRHLKKQKIKVVWTLHDCWTFTGHCTHFVNQKCEKWKTGCYQCPNRKAYPYSWFFDRSRTLYRKKKNLFTGFEDLTIVTPSQWLADLVKESFLMDYPVKVIHNGINLDVFKPSRSDFRDRYTLQDKKIVLGVAFSWGYAKGLDVINKLADLLDETYAIVLVGTTPAVEKQLSPRIISIHKTENQAQLAEIYSAADVFINPTREEVLGLVNIEANACGTPVVTFDVGGSPECIDITSGIVVPDGDILEMEKAIKDICRHHVFMAENCLERARLFDEKAKFQEYVNQYV